MKSSTRELPLGSQLLRLELYEQLLSLDFHAFEHLMQEVLRRSGYASVQMVGRKHRRGRTHSGGLDLRAYTATDLTTALTITQVKQYRRVVSRRFVDELRGAMLRVGAQQGLLLTLSTFSRVAHQAARESSVAPVTLLEGEEILDLLFTYRIGVVEQKGHWRLDEEYLDFLREKSMGTYDMTLQNNNTRNKGVA